MATDSSVDNPTKPVVMLRKQREERWAKLVAAIEQRTPITQALLESGWSPKQARKGWQAVPKQVTAMLMSKDIKAERVGDYLMRNPDKFEKRIIGKNYETMMDDAKKTVDASKLLASHKSVSSAFFQEQQNNVIVIQAPADWKPRELPKHDNQPALPPSEQDLPEYE